MKIEDYGLIGDCHTAALVGRDGSIDWLCLPRFDSGACFSKLLGTSDDGSWLLRPKAEPSRVRRFYRPGTLVLETEFELGGDAVRLLDFMPLRSGPPRLIRIIEGVRGEVPVLLELSLKFDYGLSTPWVRMQNGTLSATAGPDRIRLRTPVPLQRRGSGVVGEFTLKAEERLAFDLSWLPSHRDPPADVDPEEALAATQDWWWRWSSQCTYEDAWDDAVRRSLITLKALTYAPTGGLIAAPTTSLPELLGGARNWDYRYCWLRDATFTLYSLLLAGYQEEAKAWRDWLLRSAAGDPAQIQIMYGIGGERRLPEEEASWLPGYEGSRPVRLGNQASTQFQLDVYGEVMDAMHQCWRTGIAPSPEGWELQRSLVDHLESAWQLPDEGIWEVRGRRRPFTYSKVMAWVAFDRAVKSIEQFKLDGPVDRWKAVRDRIHDDVCSKGFSSSKGAFTQSYGSDHLDASLLLIPSVGFLPPDDPRVRGTVEAVERELIEDGFILRYRNDPKIDGLPAGEGAFLLCSCWYADALHLQGRTDDAKAVFERILSVRNDLGLLSESYDVDAKRMVGNFPQAFSHVGLVNTARNLSRRGGPADHRRTT